MSAGPAGGTQVTYTTPAINCGGCKQTIEIKLGTLEGVNSVVVDMGSRWKFASVEVKFRSRACLRAGPVYFLPRTDVLCLLRIAQTRRPNA
jgi:copper chaperone CopZ